jgi:alkylated DNA repair dioxygenase AlkB
MFDLFKQRRILLDFDGKIEIIEEILAPYEADELLEELIERTPWKQKKITLYGKTHNVPRLTAWYGDSGADYSYSNIPMIRNNWTPSLLKLKKIIETEANQEFNSVLINYYRNGSDYAAWHSDDENQLGVNPTIASLSLGEQRSFHLKHKFDKGVEVSKFQLRHNSLLIMSGKLQHCWKHQIAKSSKPLKSRVNLTFRHIRQ